MTPQHARPCRGPAQLRPTARPKPTPRLQGAVTTLELCSKYAPTGGPVGACFNAVTSQQCGQPLPLQAGGTLELVLAQTCPLGECGCCVYVCMLQAPRLDLRRAARHRCCLCRTPTDSRPPAPCSARLQRARPRCQQVLQALLAVRL